MKYCARGDHYKPIEEFGLRYGKPQPYCKECNRLYQREHYQKHKSVYKKDALRRKWKIRYNALEFVKRFVEDNGGCSECHETDFVVMEFDHIDRSTKTYTISQLVSMGSSIKRIENELRKCRIVCCNCHRRHTAKQLGWYKAIYEHNAPID